MRGAYARPSESFWSEGKLLGFPTKEWKFGGSRNFTRDELLKRDA